LQELYKNMKFLQFLALIAASSAMRMNPKHATPVSHVVIRSNYHDEYDSIPTPNASEIAAAK
jgi:hypothetical protein